MPSPAPLIREEAAGLACLRKAKLCSALGSVSISLSIRRSPVKRCSVGSAPLTLSPCRGAAQLSSQTHPKCRGSYQAPTPRKKPPAQCKSLCPCCASCSCSFPSHCPIITPIEPHSCWDSQTPAPQDLTQPHTTGVNGSCRITLLRGELLEVLLHLPGLLPEPCFNW